MTPEAVITALAKGLNPDEVARILDSLKRRVHHFIDPSATVHPTVRVWHYATVLQDVVLAEDVQIGSHAEIGRGSRIGARTRIGAHTFLPPNTIIGEDTFIGPSVSCSDDRFPYIRKHDDGPYCAQPPVIGNRVSIGLGAVLLPNVRIGDGAVVAAGTVVTRDGPAGCLIRGEPGRIRVPEHISADARAWLDELVGVQLAVAVPVT